MEIVSRLIWLGIGLVIIVGCSKKESPFEESELAVAEVKSKSSFDIRRYERNGVKEAGWYSCCTWYSAGEVCIALRRECLDEIVVNDMSGNSVAFEHFLEAVETGNKEVAKYFQGTEHKKLFPGMQQPEVEDLAKGYVTFVELTSESEDHRYFGNVDTKNQKENYYVVQFKM